VTLEGPKKRPIRKDVWIIYHSGEGAKSRGVSQEEKYLRDAQLLEDHLRQHPDNARSWYYLGQSFEHAGHLEEAHEAYKKRVTMEGWAEETFIAQLGVGRMAIRLGHSEQVVLQELLAAYEMRPSRAEPLYELAKYFRGKQRYGKAFLFAKAGVYTPRPNDALFVAQTIYDWQLLDELAVASYWVAEYSACKAVCEEILRRVEAGIEVPEADLQRIRDNLAFAEGRLASRGPGPISKETETDKPDSKTADDPEETEY
jgi:tetratricopeptide (TPR) repeat protein